MGVPRQNALQRLNRKSISAKDIANQFWCEKQMELYYTHPTRMTYAMEQGTAIHEKMQGEVYVPLTVEPATWPDRLYKTAYENILTLNTLHKDMMGRELKVYGSLNGYSVVGQIDELRMVNGKVTIVENKTTNPGRKLEAEYTKPHIVQVMLYRRMMDEIRDRAYGYQNFQVLYKTDTMKMSDKFIEGLKSIGLKDELLSLKEIYTRMFNEVSALPGFNDELVVHYLDRNTNKSITEMTVRYDRAAIDKDIIYALKYWNGERDAAPVPESEKWKCNICRFFGKECKVWWSG
jgi:exonuclease V